MFNGSLKTTSVSFFITDFNLLFCEFDSFTIKLCIDLFYIDLILNQIKLLCNTFTNLL